MSDSMPARPSKDEYYLQIAHAISQRSTCLRSRYGAIIVKNDVIVSSGYNGAARKVKDCLELGVCLKDEMKMPHFSGYDACHSVHAEANSVVNAARSGANVFGGTMFVSGEDSKTGKIVEARPCTFCRRLLINTGIEKVVFRKPDGSIGEYNIDEWIRDETDGHLKKIRDNKKL